MRFGLLYDFSNPERWWRDPTRLYRALLEQAQLAEELGYDSIWVSEHHFVDDGYCPSPLAALAALAARTRRIALGTHVLLLPLHHPLRVAEDAATVDILSGGRLILGVGLGYRLEEFETYDIARATRPTRLDESLAILELAWRGEPFSHHGHHFQFSHVAVRPRPVHDGGVPIWLGARGGRAVERVAQLGLPWLAADGSGWAAYRRALRVCGRTETGITVSIQWPVYVAEDHRQAWMDVKDQLGYMRAGYAAWSSAAADLPDDRALASVATAPLQQDYCIGDPDAVLERIQRLCERIPVDTLIMRMQFPGMDPANSSRSVELFAREVPPRVRSAEANRSHAS